MTIDDILYEAIDTVRGVKFAGLVGTDGLGVRMAFDEDDEGYDLELAEIEIAQIAATASAASNRIGSGPLRDLVIEADDLTYLASLIHPGYYAVLGIRSDANIDRGRFAVYRIIERVKREL
jgi:predicted regulator of Ras-like GTPase activity (Roadblock/LC7/MglB family)